MVSLGAWSGLAYGMLGLASLAVAVFVHRGTPTTRANVWLVALLAALGSYQLLYGAYSIPFWGLAWAPPVVHEALARATLFGFTVLPAVYLWFVAASLPGAAWWHRPAVLWSLLATLTATGAVLAAWPALLAGRALLPGIYAGGAVSVLALIVSVRQVRRTTAGSQARRSAWAFLLAFSFRNLLLLRDLLRALSLDVFGREVYVGPRAWYVGWNFDLWQDVALEGSMLAILVYGVLAGQLVTLDDRIKASIRNGTVTAVVAATFLLLTEGVEIVLGLESTALALLAAAVVALAVQPLQVQAERLATRLVPGAHAVRGMSRAQRELAYQEQARLAWQDGRLAAKERAMLDRLQEMLGLSAEACRAIEARHAPAERTGPRVGVAGTADHPPSK